MDFFGAAMNAARLQVDSVVAHQYRRCVVRPIHAAQQHADAGDEFAHAERLRQVVIGADAESDQHVGLVAARRQHQHGRRPHCLYPPTYLQTIEPRQHDVEHHQVRFGGRGRRDRRRSVDGGFYEKVLGAQASRDCGQDGRFVVDHQDSLHTPDCRCLVWRFWVAVVKIPWRNAA
jgi:hypothetical protein